MSKNNNKHNHNQTATITHKPEVATVQPNQADIMAQLEELRAQNKALEEKLSKGKGLAGLSFKVSAKGAASIYGLGRFPVTLYKGQWDRLLADDFMVQFKTFLNENKELATKPVSK